MGQSEDWFISKAVKWRTAVTVLSIWVKSPRLTSGLTQIASARAPEETDQYEAFGSPVEAFNPWPLYPAEGHRRICMNTDATYYNLFHLSADAHIDLGCPGEP